MFPDLKRLERKYAKELVVIGVHSAKFTNEKDGDNLRDAILRHGLENPIVNDPDFKIFRAYEAGGWPHFVLIDPEGYIAAETSGEGRYAELDSAIAKLVKEFTIDRTELAFTKEKPRTGVLAYPGKVLATADRLYISDTNHDRVIETDLTGKILREIGGFYRPQGLAIGGKKLYVADTENHRVCEVDLDTFAMKPAATKLNSPWDLAVDGDQVYVAMAGDHRIWRLDGPFSGSGREELTDGPHAKAAYAQPSGLAIAGKVMYVADSESSAIREIDLDPKGSARTIVGKGLFVFGDVDGAGDAARLQHPLGVVWHDGRLYIADAYNHKIKVCDPAKRQVRTLFSGFREPGGLSAWGDRLYVADTNRHEIRVCDLRTKEGKALDIRP